MTHKVLRSTPRGQITLPKQWRKNFSTDNFLVEMHDDKLVITPLHVSAAAMEEVLFDADRDNDGKGVPVEDMITLLKKIRHG